MLSVTEISADRIIFRLIASTLVSQIIFLEVFKSVFQPTRCFAKK
jgi:hypothetical protein